MSIASVLAAGLASVGGALITSWLGTQGTLIGAIMGATIGSAVSQTVQAPLAGLERRILSAGVSARRLRQDGLLKTILVSPTARAEAIRTITRGAILTVSATAIIGFLLGISSITAVEAARGEPISALVTDQPASGTTIGNLVPETAPLPPVVRGSTATPTSAAAQTADTGRAAGGVAAPSATTPSTTAEIAPTLPGLISSPSPSPDQAISSGGVSSSPEPDQIVSGSPSPDLTPLATASGSVTPAAATATTVSGTATIVSGTATTVAGTATIVSGTATTLAGTATVLSATATSVSATATALVPAAPSNVSPSATPVPATETPLPTSPTVPPAARVSAVTP